MQQWEEQHSIGSLADVHAAAETWAAENALRQADEQIRRIAAEAPTGHPVTMPCPPELDPERWATLDRKTRRELWRHRRKLQRRAGR